MVRPLSVDTRQQIYHLFSVMNLSAEDIWASIPVKVSLDYMRKLTKRLRNPHFAVTYLEGARHPPGRPQVPEEEKEYLLQLQAENATYTLPKLYAR